MDVIGICDLGASGGKIFLSYLSGDNICLRQVYRFANRPLSCLGKDSNGCVIRRWNWDFERIWQEILNGLAVIGGLDDVNMVSFGIDTWGSDGAWMDKQGDRLCPVAAGRDGRWETARQKIIEEVSAEKLFNLTGVQSYPFNVINQLYWYKKHKPELVSMADKFMPLHSILYYLLAGSKVAEYTWMSTTQLCSAGKQQYSKDIFETLSLPLDKMPELVAPMTSLGKCYSELAADLNLSEFEVIVPAVHDTACAYSTVLSSSKKKALIVSSGTWALTGVYLDKPNKSGKAFNSGFSNEAGADGNNRFLKNLMGTWPAQQLRHKWSAQDGVEMTWEEFDELAESGHPSEILIDIDDPIFFNPVDMEEAVRKFCLQTGQKLFDDRGQMACAVYKSLALKIAKAAEQVSSITGESLDEIVLLGGGVKSKILSQWIANAVDLPVRKGAVEATAFGNACLQAKALGWIGELEEVVIADSSEVVAAENDNYWS